MYQILNDWVGIKNAALFGWDRANIGPDKAEGLSKDKDNPSKSGSLRLK